MGSTKIEHSQNHRQKELSFDIAYKASKLSITINAISQIMKVKTLKQPFIIFQDYKKMEC